jgi:hypothetical protein
MYYSAKEKSDLFHINRFTVDWSKVAVAYLAEFLRIRNVPGSNLEPEIGYSD